jgi:hypothetical protein
MNLLISALYDRSAIGTDNVITASYTLRDGSGKRTKKVGDFGVLSIDRTDSHINFALQHMIDKHRVTVSDDQILAIDGMVPSRYADVYDLNLDGTVKKVGKKRGRKPKNMN